MAYKNLINKNRENIKNTNVTNKNLDQAEIFEYYQKELLKETMKLCFNFLICLEKAERDFEEADDNYMYV